MGEIKHAHQTIIADDPAQDVSATEWNEAHNFSLSASDVDGVVPESGANSIVFDTTPTVGDFADGKIYYDALNKCLALETGGDVTLQIGQEDLRLVYNNTASTILNGKAVYTSGVYNGGTNDVATVALAKADNESTYNVLGCATQNIDPDTYGFITVRGHINGLDTTTMGSAGDSLYLSADNAGDLVNTPPVAPNYEVRVGRLITSSATEGRINVRVWQAYRLGDLADVSSSSPLVDQVLTFNGVEWINSTTPQASVGTADSYIFCEDNMTTTITPTVPQSTIAGVTVDWHELERNSDGGALGNHVLSSGTTYVQSDRYITKALNTTTMPSGDWSFKMFVKTDTASRYGQLKADIYQIATDGTVKAKLNTTSAETILFNNVAVSVVQMSCYTPTTTFLTTDRIGIVIYARRNQNSGTITWYHDVSLGYVSSVTTPISLLHNLGKGLQGGSTEERYHMTLAEYGVVQATSGANTGDEVTATDIAEGIAELATLAEVNAGTDAGRIVTPDTLSGSVLGRKNLQFKLIDDATALTTGDGKLIWMVPQDYNGWNVVAVAAYVSTVSSSGLPTFQVRNVTDAVDVLSTKVSINANAYTSYNATTPAVVDTSKDDLATGDLIAFDCDVAGSGAKGAGINLTLQIP